MKRIFWIVSILLLTVGLMPVDALAASKNTNNFRITSYDIQYELSRDSESRSVLKTTETITALFPSYDQNRGLERAIPVNYDGHPTSLNVTTVTNEKGDELEYSTDGSNGNRILRIGNPDAYVHGLQTYKITYEQRDVTRYFEDNQRDEWYWDTNGTEWKVPINTLSVSVKIDPSLSDARVGEPACYEGTAGATETCKVTKNEDGNTYTVKAANLNAKENLTLAFGFNQGTFAEYKQSPIDRFLELWGIAQIVSFPVAAAALIGLSIALYRRIYRKSEENPIPAEYVPPKDSSVVVSSQLISATLSVFSAQLIDLAVRRYISIVETREKSRWKTAEYDIVILKSVEDLREEEREILTDMFGHVPKQGERLSLSKLKNNMSYSMRTLDNDKKLKQLLEGTYGIKEKSPIDTKFFYRWATALLIVGILTLTFMLLIAAITVFIYGYTFKRLSDKGLALRRYVLGLDKYIKASETERLAFLQGPDTAQKVGYDVDPNNPGQVVKLYERVLPYAILFGQEKEWSKRLGEFYEQAGTNPDWYSGMTVFNAAAFTSGIHNFSQASSYSANSSSSSGGSSGGGSSGGGGGGGGGGGW